ncbi:MAG: hypothetical protein A3G34_12265 [Candidatus Lindowbacteria bacterium RIFCSPLOWO2_12_FULL_62_27]|nr:MAG: hypothetical protein A3G34_12265 [Candidatus Lindowbacteria bacterium RIFCSPLOWO2_12_FULL_62_27]OGH63529.1 MAG: hypothetical protein A3I06_05115 [Candidatus Lindowbacteria bacterium RIFCSPLOWO2_02_FULL_62_12]
MKTGKWIGRAGLAGMILLSFNVAHAVENGGIVSGAVTYKGKGRPANLKVDHDLEVCGKHPIRDESLLVAADGGLANAVVWLEGVSGGKEMPTSEAAMDQSGCAYVPHVLAIGVGQKILFKNSDAVLHNINSFPKENRPLNLSLLAAGQGRPLKRSFPLADEIKVTCDAHKWMSAWIVVRDNPYFAVTDSKGRYKIADIPPGKYRLVVWHETAGRMQKDIVVQPKKAATENLALPAAKR